MVTSRDHSQLELSTIKSYQILTLKFSLKLHCKIKVLANNLVFDEKVNSHLDLTITFSSDIDDITQILSFEPFKLLTVEFSWLILILRNIFKNEYVFSQPFLFEEFSAVLRGLNRVNNQVPQSLAESNFDRCVILLVDWLNELIHLSVIPFAFSLELLQNF